MAFTRTAWSTRFLGAIIRCWPISVFTLENLAAVAGADDRLSPRSLHPLADE